jgi:myosin protein heavy chain
MQAMLEKQVKELNVRIVDLETKSYSRMPQSSGGGDQATIRGLRSRLEELTRELNNTANQHDRASISRGREATMRLAESDRQRSKLEEEVNAYEQKVNAMRQAMDVMVCVYVSVAPSVMLTIG